MKAPAILSTPAPITATNGLITRVETTVAMALALSCHPFEKSNSSASTTTRSNIPVRSGILFQCSGEESVVRKLVTPSSVVFQCDAFENVGDIFTTVGAGFERFVDFFPLDDRHGIGFFFE